jgi:hypothetical protein
MTTMADHLADVTIDAATPDGIAFATLRGQSDVRVSFAPGYYAHADDARVADKLAQLGKLLWVARMKEYYRFKSEQLGRTVRGEAEPVTDAQRARRQARDAIVATGRSVDGTVEATAVGLFGWTVRIAPGTVPRMPEEQFCAAVSQAARGLIEDHLFQLKVVWAQPYGPERGRPVARRGSSPLPPPRRP